jgi:hypothetical protein
MKKRTTQLFKSSHLEVPECVLHMIVFHRQFYHLGWARYSPIRGNTLSTPWTNRYLMQVYNRYQSALCLWQSNGFKK